MPTSKKTDLCGTVCFQITLLLDSVPCINQPLQKIVPLQALLPFSVPRLEVGNGVLLLLEDKGYGPQRLDGCVEVRAERIGCRVVPLDLVPEQMSLMQAGVRATDRAPFFRLHSDRSVANLR